MKHAALILAIVFLLSLAACGRGGQSALSPTEAPTESVTEAPTPAPTDTSAPTDTPVPTDTPAPTEPPDFSGLIPQIGKLVDGPIFPEPAKYLVLSGEGDNFYVYNNMGELVRTFKAVEDEYLWGGPGFYGEDGICENVKISTGETLPRFRLFGSTFIFLDLDWENDVFSLIGLADEDLEPLFFFPEDERPDIGYMGGVIPFDGNFLVLRRGFDWEDDSSNCEMTVYDPKGREICSVDTEPFGEILGVFGGKYIVGGVSKEPDENDDYDEFGNYDCTLFTLEGKKVKEHVHPVLSEYFSISDEGIWGSLCKFDHLYDPNGGYLDAELKHVDSIPEYGESARPLRLRYGNLDWELREQGYTADNGYGLYAGVRLIDEDSKPGEWLFRIYNPRYANDYDNEHDVDYHLWG